MNIGIYWNFGASWTKRELRSDIRKRNGDETSWPCASARLVQNEPLWGDDCNNNKNKKQQPSVHQQPPVDIAPTVIR